MDIKRLAYVLPMLAVFMPQTVSAEVYKWVDENGEVHYSQQKPDSHEAKPMNIVTQPMISGTETINSDTNSGARGLAQQCSTQESIEQYGTTYCCTASCVTQRRTKNLPFSCATQKCYEALLDSDAERRKSKEAQDRKDKQQAEYARMQAEAVQNTERLKRERDQAQMDRQQAIARRNQERMQQQIDRQMYR